LEPKAQGKNGKPKFVPQWLENGKVLVNFGRKTLGLPSCPNIKCPHLL